VQVLAVTLVVFVLAVTAGPASGYGGPVELFRFRDDRIGESSGVAASSMRDGLVFTHNDSGDGARFFAVDFHGCTLATYNLSGADAIDWEDMARGPADDGTPALFFGDVGDNFHERSEGVAIYRVREPEMNESGGRTAPMCPTGVEKTVSAGRFDLAFPDKPHDVETLLVHPVTGQVFLVTKTYWGDTALYAAPDPLVAGEVNVLSRVAQVVIPPSTTIGEPVPTAIRFATTAGDISPDGARVVIRTYTDAWEWTIVNGDLAGAFAALPQRIDVPQTTQPEAITYTRDGRSLIVTTEGVHSPVHLIPG
jgi:hypothetical protein